MQYAEVRQPIAVLRDEGTLRDGVATTKPLEIGDAIARFIDNQPGMSWAGHLA